MKRSQSARILGSFALVLVAAGSTSSAAIAQEAAAVTLRLAVSDAGDRPSAPIVEAFVQEVATRSAGSVTVEPIWSAAGPDDFEQGVARLLVDGRAELGLAAGRAWDSVGITSLKALQAPFLITDDALAIAVSTSPIADELLAGMAGKGISGLAIWPEDLRHPATFESCSDPIVSPEQFAGLAVRAIPSGVTTDLLETLGATRVESVAQEDVDSCRVHAVESGLRQGQSLPGHPTFTGDVSFFPKYQVLAANSAAFERLSDPQRTAITEAAIAARDKAVADHPSEVDAAIEWCGAGGQVVLAGPSGVAAFEQAAEPVLERIAQDTVAAAAIESIRALKAETEPAPGAVACEPVADPSFAIPDTAGYSGDLPPNGRYRSIVTAEELVAGGASPAYAAATAGVRTVTFEDGRISFEAENVDGIQRFAGTMTSLGDKVRVIIPTLAGAGCGFTVDIVWRLDGDDLHMIVFGTTESRWSEQDFRNEWAWNDIPATRIE